MMVSVIENRNVLIVGRTWYPNHQLLFDEIQFQLPEYKLYYYLLSAKEKGRPWDIEGKLVNPKIIPGFYFTAFSKGVMINPGLTKYLSLVKFSLIIITPGSEIGCFTAKKFAQKRSIPSVGWIVGLREWNPNFLWRMRSVLTKSLARKFIKDQCFVFTDGTKAKNDVIKLGEVSEKDVIIVKHVIDETHFDYKNYQLGEEEKKKERAKFSLDERPLFLCISGLVRRKGLDSLLSAFEKLLRLNSNVQLLLVGDGSMRKMASDFLKKHPKNFKWIRSVPYDRIPLVYALSDYCVFPSYFDDWGNIVNECHCAKIPIICSDGVCASYDLIEHGYSGLVYKAGDVSALVELMDYALKHPKQMKIMAQNGSDFIQSEWNTKESAKIWTKYIRRAIGDE